MVLGSVAIPRSHYQLHCISVVHFHCCKSLIQSSASQYLTHPIKFVQTRTLVRASGIITQLVFEHSLRIRVKAEVAQEGDASDASTVSSVAQESDGNGSGSVSEDETLHSQGVTDSTLTAQPSSDVQAAETRSTKSTSSKKSGAKAEGEKSGSSSASNLVGKINNLVTTDMGNIVDSRDFLFIALYIPLQVTLCMVFLYNILGWRCVDITVKLR